MNSPEGPPINETDIANLSFDISLYNIAGHLKPELRIEDFEEFAHSLERESPLRSDPITLAEVALQGIELDNQDARENPAETAPVSKAEVAFMEKLLKDIDSNDK